MHQGLTVNWSSVNIAGVSLSRDQAGGHALTILNLDSVPDEALMKELLSEGDITSVQVVVL